MKVLFALVAVCLVSLVAGAPLLHTDNPNVIQDQYIVVFHKGSTVHTRDLHLAELKSKRFTSGDSIIAEYNIGGTFLGYAAILTKETLATELAHPNIQYIAADHKVSIVDDTTETQTQLPAGLWGLGRIDERDGTDLLNYRYWKSAGNNVVAYVIDTGIYVDHVQFEGRAKFGVSYITGETDTDGNGHGTHVAGTIGGFTYGVSKNVTLIAVKVLSASGSGSWAGVISGIQWVTDNHQDRGQGALSVANMSLGGGVQQSVDDALAASVKAGVNHVVAAGNSNADACNSSPSRSPTAITIGSIQQGDQRSSFSNIGSCVDVFAPGTSILSSWIGSTTATSTISGTSMASPHVAGVVAQYLGHFAAVSPGQTIPSPAEVEDWVKKTATPNLIPNPGNNSPNLIVYSPYSDPVAKI